MHILIVTTGGITRMFRNWPEVLLAKALVQRGHRVRALTYFDAKSDALNTRQENVEGIEVQRIEPNGWLTREFWSALQRGPKPDVIHIQHLRNQFAFQAAYYARRENIPYVVTPIGPLHDQYLSRDRDHPLDTEPLYHNLIWSRREIINRTSRDGRVKRHVENYFMHYPVHHANAVIACSEHERGIWAQMHIESETIPLWVDVPFISNLRGETFHQEFTRPVILFVGQFKYRKGFDVLARAMPMVLEHFPKATFLFVGHSPIHRRELEAIARKDGTHEHLEIVGRVSEEDKVRLYNSADVSVLPTRYEGFGLPPLEAMAAGCPVIASNIPVVDEVVRHEENGLLAPRDDPRAFADAILRIMRDDALRTHLIQNGFETLTRFDEKDLTARNEAVYARILQAAPVVKA
ncbi:MAG: glycosyltransferase family 4 protein [Chloroflexi bacterium]|nr:glycosyltransferase family 4 protein [Chloroflexota bacterium]